MKTKRISIKRKQKSIGGPKKRKGKRRKLISTNKYNDMVSQLWVARRVIATLLHKMGGEASFKEDYVDRQLVAPWEVDLFKDKEGLVTVTLLEDIDDNGQSDTPRNKPPNAG
jgi:hypothetical protein